MSTKDQQGRSPAALDLTIAPWPPVRWMGLAGLTDQERRVADLVGQALTNRQIARRLNISPHTVNYHLRHIFRKLAINSRVCLAQVVRTQDAIPDRAAAALVAHTQSPVL